MDEAKNDGKQTVQLNRAAIDPAVTSPAVASPAAAGAAAEKKVQRDCLHSTRSSALGLEFEIGAYEPEFDGKHSTLE